MALPHDFNTLTHARIGSEEDSNLDSLPTCTRRQYSTYPTVLPRNISPFIEQRE